MKQLFLFFFAGLVLVLGVACDRHPVSQTIPGYQEKSHLLESKQALTPARHPVKFFSEKKTTSLN